MTNRNQILELANKFRWGLGGNLHDALMESIFKEASDIAHKVVITKNEKGAFSFDKKLDKIVTNRWTGFPIMFILLAIVFWLTVQGAN